MPTGHDPDATRRASARLIVLVGPTAVGKGAVSAWVLEHDPRVWMSVSATTRPARPGEADGADYIFLDESEFDAMVQGGDLLEWAEVHGRARYGTPRRPVEEALGQGHPVLLEIDVQGARQLRETTPEARFVFLAPPSWDELVRRLVGRGTEREAEREARLATARVELEAAEEFDVIIVNDDVERAGAELVHWIWEGRTGDENIRAATAHSYAGRHRDGKNPEETRERLCPAP